MSRAPPCFYLHSLCSSWVRHSPLRRGHGYATARLAWIRPWISLRAPSRSSPIFQEYGKWAAVEKLSFWFLQAFMGGREVQKGHFRFGRSFTKCSMAAKRIYFQGTTEIWCIWCIIRSDACRPIIGLHASLRIMHQISVVPWKLFARFSVFGTEIIQPKSHSFLFSISKSVLRPKRKWPFWTSLPPMKAFRNQKLNFSTAAHLPYSRKIGEDRLGDLRDIARKY